jgi:ribonuclease HII
MTRPLIICGVDEAGRGPLAGPVYAAAVILDEAQPIAGLRDSKQLSAVQRSRLAEQIRRYARAWSVASVSAAEIDSMNILQATLLAMRRAVGALAITPELALVDGNRAPGLACNTRTIVKGDQTEPAISAASILAKTERDLVMLQMAGQFPQYRFECHKGYPTAEHLKLLQQFGPCAEHRRSFAPVRIALRANNPC